jgi:hypothetical protein
VKLCNLTDEGLTQISATWDHIRVMINADFVDRWISDNDDLWINWRWQPRKVATLAANINDSVDELSVSNADGFARDVWPASQGFFKIGDEAIFYSAERSQYGLSGLIRGVLGTTAASHTAGDVLYWIEFPYINLLYGYTAATDPQPSDDRKPLISLEDSENDSHVYGSEGLTARGTRRSMQFAMRSSDTGVGAQHTQQYADAPDQVWENNLPVAGKPALNEASRLFPVPLAGPVEIDIDVGLSMLLRGFVEDAEGYESRLIDERYTPTPLTAASYSLPGNVRKLRFVGGVGVVTGALDGAATGAQIQSVANTPGTADAEHPEIEITARYQSSGIRFTLDQETQVSGLLLRLAKSSVSAPSDSSFNVLIIPDSGGKPQVDFETINGVVPSAQPAIIVSQVVTVASLPDWDESVDFSTLATTEIDYGGNVTIPAGTYWVTFARDYGKTGRLWFNVATLTGRIIYRSDQLTFENVSGFLGVLSDETDPQSDAPYDNGDTITVANGTFPLDSTLAPWIKVGAEEDFYLLGNDTAATLSNAAADYLSLRFPMKLATDLNIDTGTRRIIDGEFGIDVPWARQASSDRWPQAAPVDETLTWEEDAALITVARERRAEYL